MLRRLTVAVVALLSLAEHAFGSCYLPNGTISTSTSSQPCSQDASNPLHAVCCETGWDNPPGGDLKLGSTKDECLPNGLCQNRGFSTIPGEEFPPWTHFYRVKCINSDWKDCLSVCDEAYNAEKTVQLTPCDGTATSEKWCCGDTNSCCSAESSHKAVIIPKLLGQRSNSSSEPLPSSTPNSAQSSNGDSKKDRDIGIGVGIGVGLPIILAIGFRLGMLFAKRQAKISVISDHEKATQEPSEQQKTGEARVGELESPQAELKANERWDVNELPADNANR